MDSAQGHKASKTPVLEKKNLPKMGLESSQAGKAKVTKSEQKVPPTELEKLDSLRSKLEQSLDEFIKARKELEEILPAEGSNEQGQLGPRSSAELKTELKRHRELTSRVESDLRRKTPRIHLQGAVRKGSSYDFLKSIMS
ncbi:uncharacterized protein si:dkey-148h10.5 [Thalassophryne amazonica]|uniref:uncharacterized protein si:dkey-148h10.5 n=1 Tax=Thalassophryne amazonica TaxID=390379 RepID=UPI001471793A|nr:uncharacterized protein si:dkey-148h10.5 [Thalassophryne amazonica]